MSDLFGGRWLPLRAALERAPWSEWRRKAMDGEVEIRGVFGGTEAVRIPLGALDETEPWGMDNSLHTELGTFAAVEVHLAGELAAKPLSPAANPIQPIAGKAQAKSAKKGTSRVTPVWKLIEDNLVEWIAENGMPQPGSGEQAALERYAITLLEKRGVKWSEAGVRRNIKRIMKR